ncbi:MAG: substrate-binding periplasmic protein, partial [Shewanella sp.]
QIRDDFNVGLKQITQDGSAAALQEKYRRLMSFDNEAEASTKLIETNIIKNDSY